jgi:hypothetical protein
VAFGRTAREHPTLVGTTRSLESRMLKERNRAGNAET